MPNWTRFPVEHVHRSYLDLLFPPAFVYTEQTEHTKLFSVLDFNASISEPKTYLLPNSRPIFCFDYLVSSSFPSTEGAWVQAGMRDAIEKVRSESAVKLNLSRPASVLFHLSTYAELDIYFSGIFFLFSKIILFLRIKLSAHFCANAHRRMSPPPNEVPRLFLGEGLVEGAP